METEITVLTQEPNNDKDSGDNVNSRQRVIIDLTAKRAASTPVKGCKSEDKLLPGLDIELAEDSDSEPARHIKKKRSLMYFRQRKKTRSTIYKYDRSQPYKIAKSNVFKTSREIRHGQLFI